MLAFSFGIRFENQRNTQSTKRRENCYLDYQVELLRCIIVHIFTNLKLYCETDFNLLHLQLVPKY